MANDAARHISPEGSPRWRWSSASSRRRDLGTEAIDRRAGDAVASGKSDSAGGTHPRYRNGRRAVVCVGAKLAAAFRQERVCPPSQLRACERL